MSKLSTMEGIALPDSFNVYNLVMDSIINESSCTVAMLGLSNLLELPISQHYTFA